MNFLKKAYCRIFQKAVRIGSNFIKRKKQDTLYGEFVLGDRLKEKLVSHNVKHPFLVISNSMKRLGVDQEMKKSGIDYYEYSGFPSEVPDKTVYEARDLYLKEHCDGLIAVGGGSAMDLAKAIGILIANKNQDLAAYKGLLKVKKPLPYLVAIPSTCGSGSEVSPALVASISGKKYPIMDPKLIPDLAVLDDYLLSSLPPHVIAETGMDALTHAIEAYIGKGGSKESDEYSLDAIELIGDNLYRFYQNPQDIHPRESVIKASYLAGKAFSIAYVGYVHALSHAIGGKYHLAHGYVNAILLPHVLKAYGGSISGKLAKISDTLNLVQANSSIQAKAYAVIEYINSLNKKMGIPERFGDMISNEDIPELVEKAYKEANPLYPVPRLLGEKELTIIMEEAK